MSIVKPKTKINTPGTVDPREADYSRAIVELGLQKARLNNDCEAKLREVNDLSVQKGVIEKQKVKLEQDIKELEKQQEETTVNYSGNIALLKSQVGTLNQIKEQIEPVLAQAQQQLEKIQNSIKELEAEIEKKKAKFNEEFAAKQKELGELLAKIETANQVFNNLEKKIEAAKIEQADIDEKNQATAADLALRELALERGNRDLAIWESRLLPHLQKDNPHLIKIL